MKIGRRKKKGMRKGGGSAWLWRDILKRGEKVNQRIEGEVKKVQSYQGNFVGQQKSRSKVATCGRDGKRRNLLPKGRPSDQGKGEKDSDAAAEQVRWEKKGSGGGGAT